MTELSTAQVLDLDRRHLWHPYASVVDAPPVYPVASAQGVHLTLTDGRRLVDGMSSWWCAVHGYNHPVLNAAAERQLRAMSHVMFGGLTHEPAARLGQLLAELTPEPLRKVFLADSGSVAVEVAIKMALQFWRSQGQAERCRLLTVRSGYHGDTFGAMSVCDPVTGMHHLFRGVLPDHLFAPAPSCGFDTAWDESYIAEFAALLGAHRAELAAVILEPIVQGAGGMHFYSPHYLRRVRELCDECDVLLIADEIATGFGRTGRLFACEHADIAPDILCLGKALTGGYLTLSATLCTEHVSDGICSGEAGVFMHGPTFMGNPLACAIAVASIQLLLSGPWEQQVAAIEAQLRRELAGCVELPGVADVRVLGAIGVVEMEDVLDVPAVQARLVDRGVWLRPFGKLLYTMPPFVIQSAELTQITSAVTEVLGG